MYRRNKAKQDHSPDVTPPAAHGRTFADEKFIKRSSLVAKEARRPLAAPTFRSRLKIPRQFGQYQLPIKIWRLGSFISSAYGIRGGRGAAAASSSCTSLLLFHFCLVFNLFHLFTFFLHLSLSLYNLLFLYLSLVLLFIIFFSFLFFPLAVFFSCSSSSSVHSSPSSIPSPLPVDSSASSSSSFLIVTTYVTDKNTSKYIVKPQSYIYQYIPGYPQGHSSQVSNGRHIIYEITH